MPVSFEEVLCVVAGLPVGQSDADRIVHWLDEHSTVGVARQPSGRMEIFIVGETLNVLSPLVRRHLRCDKWTGQSGAEFVANRIVFPSEDHFLASSAFLVEELFRNGVLVSAQAAFRKCEPIIELFLRRSALDEQSIQGLFAELLLVEMGLHLSATESEAAAVISGWRGWAAEDRDFVYPGLAIEVKSTGATSSKHKINSIGQVNARMDVDGNALEKLYVVSVGLFFSEAGGGRSLSQLVEDIINRLSVLSPSSKFLEEQLLGNISNYGTDEGQGYIHGQMKTWDVYGRLLSRTFLRIYDMSDSRIKVVGMSDVSSKIHTPAQSISFDIDLPAKIEGDINPSSDLRKLMRNALDVSMG
jgi:hypothetical protein